MYLSLGMPTSFMISFTSSQLSSFPTTNLKYLFEIKKIIVRVRGERSEGEAGGEGERGRGRGREERGRKGEERGR